MGEKKELRKWLRAANDGQRVLAEKAERYREANHALKDVVVRLEGENARLKAEVARLRRNAASAREFDIWNR
jgi:predicted RNase H-like nuclease (RuvC/YqgF family)